MQRCCISHTTHFRAIRPVSGSGISSRCYLSTSLAALAENHYVTMQIDTAATHDDIKSQFYKLSRQFHPDANTADASVEKFKALSEAYSILGDNEKRSVYDASLATSRGSRRMRRTAARPTYSNNAEGTHGQRTSAGSRAWQYDARARTMAGEASAAAARRAAQFAAAQGGIGGIGRTYHHPSQSASGLDESETVKASEYERRHAILGMRIRGGHEKPSNFGTGPSEWDRTVPFAFILLLTISLSAIYVNRGGPRKETT